MRCVGEVALKLLECVGDGLEGGAVLRTFGRRGLIFIGEAGEGREHIMMILLLFGNEFV
jgi:hypothetical protein